MINEIKIIGKIAGEIKNISKTENPMVIFSVVTWDGVGENKKSEFHQVVCFAKSAEFLIKHAKPKDQVFVSGRVEYVKLDNGMKAQIKADKIRMLGAKNEESVA